MKAKLKKIISVAIAVFTYALATAVLAQNRITASDAANYIGKTATVCGQVASVTYAVRSKGHPTFINLDRPYPNQIFTVLIWGNDRGKFSIPPENDYKGKKICVTGTITIFRGVTEIVVRNPSQISGGA